MSSERESVYGIRPSFPLLFAMKKSNEKKNNVSQAENNSRQSGEPITTEMIFPSASSFRVQHAMQRSSIRCFSSLLPFVFFSPRDDAVHPTFPIYSLDSESERTVSEYRDIRDHEASIPLRRRRRPIGALCKQSKSFNEGNSCFLIILD